MEYGGAKAKAARQMGRHSGRRASLPSNEVVEDEVRDYLALFRAESQPAELAALRHLALQWMQRLEPFRPHLTGAVWRGTATGLSAIHLDLFCDDTKSAEIAMINLGIHYEVSSLPGGRNGGVSVLSLAARTPALPDTVTLHLTLCDHDDLRGALRADSRGRTWRGNTSALQALLKDSQ